MKREHIILEGAIVTESKFIDPVEHSAGFDSGSIYDASGSIISSARRQIKYSGRKEVQQNQFSPVENLPMLAGNSIYLGMYSEMYGHFLLESLARIWYLLDNPNRYDHYLFHKLHRNQIIDPAFTPAECCFEVFGIDPGKIKLVETTYRVQNLTIPSTQVVLKDAISDGQREVYGRIADYCIASNPNLPTSECIYLSRSRFHRTKRRAQNEIEIEAAFEKLGFQIIHPQKIPFEEQVVYYNKARVLAGMSGSAMHNVVFQKLGQSSITLGNLREPISPHINQIICNRLVKSAEHYIPFKGIESSQHNNHFTFDTVYLENQLKQIEAGVSNPSKSTAVRTQKSRQICVLGMHRSGTSCLAGSIQAAGIFAGNINKSSSFQPMGNRENRFVLLCNNQLLGDQNCSWRNPALVTQWSAQSIRDREAIIQDLDSQAPVWVFKDPRTLFTFEFWREALPQMHLVATFRDPLNVALSLARRNNMPIVEALNLYNQYNQQLLSLRREQEFPVICFDSPPAEYSMQLKTVLKKLDKTLGSDFSLDVEEGLAFFQAAARHEQLYKIDQKKIEDEATASIVKESYRLYGEMVRYAEIAESPLEQAQEIYLPLGGSLATYEGTVDDESGSPVLHYLAHMEYELQADYRSAIRHLQACLDFEPDNVQHKKKLSQLFADNEQFEQSINLILETKDYGSKLLATFLKASRGLYANGQREQLLQMCLEMVDDVSTNFDWLRVIAKQIFDLGSHDLGLQMMHRCKELNPNDIRIHYEIGRCFYSLKDYERADELIDKGQAINPNRTDFSLVELRALIQDARQQKAEAIDNYYLLLNVDRLKPYCYVNLVKLLAELFRTQEAQTILEKANAQFQHRPNILTALGKIKITSTGSH